MSDSYRKRFPKGKDWKSNYQPVIVLKKKSNND